MPPHVSSFDEDGTGAHQWESYPVLDHKCALDRLIKRDKGGDELLLKVGDMRELTTQHRHGGTQPGQLYPTLLLVRVSILMGNLHASHHFLDSLARNEDFRERHNRYVLLFLRPRG